MNKKLYKKLLGFRSHSYSAAQIAFRDWLEAYIVANYTNVEVQIDTYGNMYVTKSTSEQEYVNCVIAHLDINQSVRTSSFTIVEAGNYIVGMNNETGKQIGLGHDDKVGVYFALKALEKFPNIKVFFPLDEEVGCIGSRRSVSEFFDNVGFMVQLDRRGYSDISQFTNGYATVTDSTKLELDHILSKHNFHWINTMSTDVGVLIQDYSIQGTNISCGYTNEHKDDENLHVLRYDASEKFALDILKYTDGDYFYMPVTVKKTVNTSTTSTTTTSGTSPQSTFKKDVTPSTSSVVEKTVEAKSVEEEKKTSLGTTNDAQFIPPNKIENWVADDGTEEYLSEEEQMYLDIESLYDDTLDTDNEVEDFKEKVMDILDEWQLLSESYEKDALMAKFKTVLTDVQFALNTDKIDKEVYMVTEEWNWIADQYVKNGYESEEKVYFDIMSQYTFV